MPILYKIKCPHCNKSTTLDIYGACTNQLNNGAVCSYSFTWSDETALNSKQRKKRDKHSSPPLFPSTADCSWCLNKTDFMLDRQCVALSGQIMLDPVNNYLCLWDARDNGNPIAKLFTVNDDKIHDVNGIKMPLNSKPNNLHHHYSNLEESLISIPINSDELTICFPDVSQSGDFEILSASEHLWSWHSGLSSFEAIE